jgi:putative FmdB family regulatory protein
MQGSPDLAEVSMPFYEYDCQACGTRHEAMQKMSDAPLKICPECGKSALVRLISAPVFRLKGGGWYETDFKSDKEKKRNLAGGEDKPSGDGDAATRRKAAKKAPATDAKAKSGAPAPAAKPSSKRKAAAQQTAAVKPAAAKATSKTPAKAKAKPKATAKPKAKASAKAPARAAKKTSARAKTKASPRKKASKA